MHVARMEEILPSITELAGQHDDSKGICQRPLPSLSDCAVANQITKPGLSMLDSSPELIEDTSYRTLVPARRSRKRRAGSSVWQSVPSTSHSFGNTLRYPAVISSRLKTPTTQGLSIEPIFIFFGSPISLPLPSFSPNTSFDASTSNKTCCQLLTNSVAKLESIWGLICAIGCR